MANDRRPLKFEPLVGDNLVGIGRGITEEVDVCPTPFPSWNALCGEEGGREGVAKTWVVVIGGADGSGKSYTACNLAAYGVRHGKKCGFINFEMTKVALTQRYLAILSGHPKFKLEHGRNFSMDHWIRASAVADEVYRETGGLLLTNDSQVFRLADIREAYMKFADAGVEAVFLDYAQLVHVQGVSGIYERSEAVGNELRELTHRYNVSSFILSQFNRDGKKLSEIPPTRHYLAGGGAWENNANQIAIIDHTFKLRDPETGMIYTQLVMDKNRHGDMPVEIPVAWNTLNMRWEEGGPPPALTGVVEDADTPLVDDEKFF